MSSCKLVERGEDFGMARQYCVNVFVCLFLSFMNLALYDFFNTSITITLTLVVFSLCTPKYICVCVSVCESDHVIERLKLKE